MTNPTNVQETRIRELEIEVNRLKSELLAQTPSELSERVETLETENAYLRREASRAAAATCRSRLLTVAVR